MKSKLGDSARLHHILHAISEIELYVRDLSLEEFRKTSVIKFAAIKQLEIIGEAANRLSIELREKHGKVSWREIVGLRNLLIHEYFGIDTNVGWGIIVKDIPELKEQVTKILATIEKNNPNDQQL